MTAFIIQVAGLQRKFASTLSVRSPARLACAMAVVTWPTRRLRRKTAVPVKQKCQRTTALRTAKRDGVLKRTPTSGYAAFCAEKASCVPGGRSRMQKLSVMWKALSQDARAGYRAQAAAGVARRHELAAAHGVRVRRRRPAASAPCAVAGVSAPGDAAAARGDGVSSPGGAAAAPGAGVPPPGGHAEEVVEVPSRIGAFKVVADASGGFPYVGRGSYGTVIHAIHPRTGEVAMLKFYDDAAELDHEVHVYRKLPLEAASFQRYFASGMLPLPWLAMSAGPPNLLARLRSRGPLPPVLVEALAAQVVIGLGQLVVAGFLHLDLKSGNILWCEQSRRAWIVDFGLCEPWPVPANHKFSAACYCTPGYRPPELAGLSNRGDLVAHVSPAVDVFSLGCVAFEALQNDRLFKTKQDAEAWVARLMGRHALSRAAVFWRLERLPAPWQNFVKSCCHPAPRSRPRLCDATSDIHGREWVEARMALR